MRPLRTGPTPQGEPYEGEPLGAQLGRWSGGSRTALSSDEVIEEDDPDVLTMVCSVPATTKSGAQEVDPDRAALLGTRKPGRSTSSRRLRKRVLPARDVDSLGTLCPGLRSGAGA